jgi:hypothetical protein
MFITSARQRMHGWMGAHAAKDCADDCAPLFVSGKLASRSVCSDSSAHSRVASAAVPCSDEAVCKARTGAHSWFTGCVLRLKTLKPS